MGVLCTVAAGLGKVVGGLGRVAGGLGRVVVEIGRVVRGGYGNLLSRHMG